MPNVGGLPSRCRCLLPAWLSPVPTWALPAAGRLRLLALPLLLLLLLCTIHGLNHGVSHSCLLVSHRCLFRARIGLVLVSGATKVRSSAGLGRRDGNRLFVLAPAAACCAALLC